MKKIFKLVIAGFIAIIIIILLIPLLMQFMKTPDASQKELVITETDFEFYGAPCHPRQGDGIQGIRKIDWLDDSTLKIEINQNISCSYELTDADYEIIDDTIILKISSNNNSDSTYTCVCLRNLNYTIKNIEKKDYLFEIEESYFRKGKFNSSNKTSLSDADSEIILINELD